MTGSFRPERLTEARKAREMTMAVLAELAGRSPSSISHYENGRTTPNMDVAAQLAQLLNVRVELFFLASRPDADGPTFFRSMSAATKRSRQRADIRINWIWDILRFVEQKVELPRVSLPAVPKMPWKSLSRPDIEIHADALRHHWNLGNGPLSNIVWLAEEAGVVVIRDHIGNHYLDAHHRWCGSRPLIVLNSDKQSAVRSRFDCAHELAHACVHQRVRTSEVQGAESRKEMERQANQFAAAFLLPAESFVREVKSTSLDALLLLKMRWRVSLSAIIRRCRDLDLVTKNEERRLWRLKSARGWTKREPLDDEIFPEQPRLLASAMSAVFSYGLSSRSELIAETGLSLTEINNLAGLADGFFDDEPLQVHPIRPRLSRE